MAKIAISEPGTTIEYDQCSAFITVHTDNSSMIRKLKHFMQKKRGYRILREMKNPSGETISFDVVVPRKLLKKIAWR